MGMRSTRSQLVTFGGTVLINSKPPLDSSTVNPYATGGRARRAR